MIDRNLGRSNPLFQITNNPQTFFSLISRHGQYVRILESRKCPCVKEDGHPSNGCKKCRGEGEVYHYQRELLETDEINHVTQTNRCKIEPYRVPLLRPVRVERLLPSKIGGIEPYDIESYDSNSIIIKTDHPPRRYHAIRLSYYFDRYDYIQGEQLIRSKKVNTLFKAPSVLLDPKYLHSQHIEVSGDIVLIEKLYSDTKIYTNYEYSKNLIFIHGNIPDNEIIYADYYYAKPAQVIPSKMDNSEEIVQKAIRLPMGELNIGLEPWWDIGRGDLITFLMTEYIHDEIITHSGTTDKLSQFDVSSLPSQIYSKENVFDEGSDYFLFNYRYVLWFGRKPMIGEKYSIRYKYHPTYRVGNQEAEPNNLDSKQFPKVVRAKLWTGGTDIEPQKIDKQGYVSNENGERSIWPE